MTSTRREFLSVTAGLVSARAAGARQPRPRVRKNVKGLNAMSPDIQAMKDGIAAMRKLPANDPRNWVRFAAIHGDSKTGKYKDCKHGDWFFLPWHRAYVHSFELVIQNLTGKNDFAVPYWAWEADYQLPALFNLKGIDEFNNPVVQGLGNLGRKHPMQFKPEDAKKHFSKRALDDLHELTFPFLGGSITKEKNLTRRQPGNLETGPHAFIHAWVDGDMAGAGAAFDPIFWPHHANVDRFWDRWATNHPKGTPDDGDWLKAELKGLCDGKGDPLKFTVADTLGDKLGYRYDDAPDGSAKMEPSAEWKSTRLVPGAAGKFLVQESTAGVSKVTFGAFNKPASDAFDTVTNPKNARREVTVRVLMSFNTKGDPRLALDVHLLVEGRGDELGPDAPGFIASVFPWQFQHEHGGHEQQAPAIALDATAALRRLYPKGLPAGGPDFSIAFKAAPVNGDRWNGKLADVLPSETRIDFFLRGE